MSPTQGNHYSDAALVPDFTTLSTDRYQASSSDYMEAFFQRAYVWTIGVLKGGLTGHPHLFMPQDLAKAGIGFTLAAGGKDLDSGLRGCFVIIEQLPLSGHCSTVSDYLVDNASLLPTLENYRRIGGQCPGAPGASLAGGMYGSVQPSRRCRTLLLFEDGHPGDHQQ